MEKGRGFLRRRGEEERERKGSTRFLQKRKELFLPKTFEP